MKNTIGDRIRTARKAANLSQSQLGKAVGVAGSGVSQWESDSTEPTGRKLIALCHKLGVTPEHILTGIDNNRDKTGYPVVNPQTIDEYLSNEGPLKADQYVRSLRNYPANTFCWLVPDDSLQSVIPEGSTVFIDPDLDINNPAFDAVMMISLIKVRNRHALRERHDDFGKIVYIATNGDHRTITAAECKVLGHVVGIAERTWSGSEIELLNRAD